MNKTDVSRGRFVQKRKLINTNTPNRAVEPKPAAMNRNPLTYDRSVVFPSRLRDCVTCFRHDFALRANRACHGSDGGAGQRDN